MQNTNNGIPGEGILSSLKINEIIEPSSRLDPFDLENFRLDPSTLGQLSAKKLLTTVPVKKPGKQAFIRVHPGEDYRLQATFIDMKDDRETYLVTNPIVPQLADTECIQATLYVCITRQNELFLWPVRLPSPDGKKNLWHSSAREGAELAMESWIRIVANMGAGHYDMYRAEGDLPEPQWPSYTLQDLIRIAFKDQLIGTTEHLVLQKLRGLI